MTIRRQDTRDDDRRGAVAVKDVYVGRPVARHAAATTGETEIVSSHPGGWTVARSWMVTLTLVVAFVVLVIETLLAFRLVFALAGANPANGFVDFIYDFSGPFVAPFENIANERVSGSSVFEPETVIAMAVYIVGALLFAVFLSVVSSAPAPHGEHAVTSRERRVRYDREM